MARAVFILLLGFAAPAAAQISRDPNGVNVNASGATTVFITYGNLDGKVPVEATWCGEIEPAPPPAIGTRCVPGTIFGNLPLRYDQSRFTPGRDGFTDIMSIPPSVARRAYQAAEAGATSSFFYVRRFVDPAGARPDEYVVVTCRMAGGGARVPFALVDVRLGFDSEELVLSLGPDETAPPFAARIVYNGTGRLIGRWEVVLPGEEPPVEQDLLTEGSLPPELRGTQKRYTELERFNIFLPPTGEFTLPGPDPELLPQSLNGLYLILLRIEADDDKEGDSSLDRANAGTGLVHSGAVAGFPMPPLRYYVGGGAGVGLATAGLQLLGPPADATVPLTEPLVFSWSAAGAAVIYRLEVVNAAGDEVLSALLQSVTASYEAPAWLAERVGGEPFQWRVVALGAEGSPQEATPWRTAHFGAGRAAAEPAPVQDQEPVPPGGAR
ncbi:MAG: hypothetical protein ABR559_08710 [Gemmatimonadota bacterium]